MSFSKEFLEQLKNTVDIVDVVGYAGVTLSKSGRHHKGICPFHSEKSPSFFVYDDTQSFYCFGCGKGGDAITFVMSYEGLEYVDTVKSLATRYGVPIPNNDNIYDEKSKLRDKIYKINRVVARHYFNNLISEKGKIAYHYLKNRGLSNETIKTFGLGYALDDFNDSIDFLKGQGFTLDEIVASNIGARSKNGSIYSQFRNRIIFPIIDVKGQVIAFGGRALSDKGPKYLNSAETLIFNKSSNLYSLNKAKNDCSEFIILVEGYMDVVAMYQSGFINTVATLGTALTEKQAMLLSKYSGKAIICYDSDEAGKNAAKRAVNILKNTTLDVKVVDIINAKDPDEFIVKYGATRFKNLLHKGEDGILYQFHIDKEKYNLNNAEDKIKYIRQCLGIILPLNSPLEIENYVNQLSKDTSIDKVVILEEFRLLKSKKKKKESYKKKITFYNSINENNRDKINIEKNSHLSLAICEENLIVAIIKNPQLLEFVKKNISVSDIVTSYNKKILQVIFENSESDISITLLTNFLDSEAINRISKWLAEKQSIINNERTILEMIKKIKTEALNVHNNTVNMDDHYMLNLAYELKKQKGRGTV